MAVIHVSLEEPIVVPSAGGTVYYGTDPCLKQTQPLFVKIGKTEIEFRLAWYGINASTQSFDPETDEFMLKSATIFANGIDVLSETNDT
jgi:hypothetical protein